MDIASEKLAAILAGNEGFVNERFTPMPVHTPQIAVLSCADARVDVASIFSQPPNVIYSVRTAGNSVSKTDKELASIRFAIERFDVPILMVLGHTGCAAVRSVIELSATGETPPWLAPIFDAVSPGLEQELANAPVHDGNSDHFEQLVSNCERANVTAQVRRLREHPDLGPLIAEHNVLLVGALFDVITGRVSPIMA